MPIQIHEEDGGRILAVHFSGKLTKSDYAGLEPALDRLLRLHPKMRLEFEMTDFHGWDAGAMWEDLKIGFAHYADIERIAMVGEKKWQHSMALLCKPFTKATVRYYDLVDAVEARKWLEERAAA